MGLESYRPINSLQMRSLKTKFGKHRKPNCTRPNGWSGTYRDLVEIQRKEFFEENFCSQIRWERN